MRFSASDTAWLRRLQTLGLALCLGALLEGCKKDQPTIQDARDKRHPADLLSIVDGNQRYQSPNCPVGSYDSLLSLASSEQTALSSDFYKSIQKDLPSFVEIKPVEASLSSSRPSTYHIDLNFAIAGINLCQYHGRFHSTPRQQFVKGDLPSKLPPAIDPKTLNWHEDINAWLTTASEQVQADPTQLVLYRSERCLFVAGEAYQPAWELAFYLDKKPYQALVVEGQVTEITPNFVQLSGSSQVFEQASGERELQTVQLENLQVGGYLCNKHVTTRVPSDRPLAFNEQMTFHFPSDDIRFKEVSAFTSVYTMWQWFLKKKPTNWARAPVEVVLTDDPSRIADGPVYENPDIQRSLWRPTIYAPDALGKTGQYSLTNINTDFDALAHELGHHIIFQYVQIDRNLEHKALLEAWADFFVMAKTGDACLGETICPAGSDICTVPGCLRSGENDLTYQSDEYTKMGTSHHLKSQLISAFLWSIHKKQAVPLDHVGDMLFFALPYMARKTNYTDFLAALFTAEQELTNGKHTCNIYREAMNRGFASIIPQSISCPSN